ncbi:glycosyltransferase [Flavobacterium bomense]|uniref:Glycosyltransferase n=1 Tax=Flavobacterium bomense TaxID=2497483 RepID=A0A432CN64_9FLAO|nr:MULTISPECIES: glycosyltransferase [Flavobacterium]RTY66260.1 glycosyltransferase [Flavobacterium sp. LB2P53]RTZ05512.1 glycosyltransferase [Flavobacterium bomense]
MKRVLFYSSVKDYKLFKLTGFYVEDVKVLEEAGFSVICTNRYIPFLKFWKYDVAFLYFYKKSLIPALFARLFFKKVIYTGGIDELSKNIVLNKKRRAVFRFFFKINYLFSDSCNIVSKGDFINVIKVLEKFPKMSSSKLSYSPHSINVVDYNFANSFEKENIITTICWMSTISNVKRKGVDKTIHLFKKIKANHKDYKLYLIGSFGEGSDYLKGIIKKEGLEDSVIFTGNIDENYKINLLSRSKYYMQLSIYEGFGIAVIEAMMLNNFVFHTGNGGLQDTIGDGGYLIKDFNEYYDAVMFFDELENEQFIDAKQLEKNKQFVIDNFSRSSRAKYFKNIILD